MLRYLRIYFCFLRFSLSRALQFRVDFFFRVVMDTVFYAVHLAFFGVIYQHTTAVGGWSFDQTVIFISGFFLLDAIYMTFFSNNLWWLPFLINRGDLDYYLVRPISSLFFVSLREFAANSFLNLLIATGILTWAVARYPGELGAGRIALFVALIGCGAILYTAIYMIFMIPVFWTHSESGLRQIFFGLTRFAYYPDALYEGWLRRVLITGIPLALVASYPARVLFDGPRFDNLGHLLLVTAIVVTVMALLWRRGLRAYASASS